MIIALDSPKGLKNMVGEDMISLSTVDNQRAQTELKERYHIKTRHDGEQITFEVANGERFIPTLIKEFDTDILSINLRRPALDDVFLKLTGHRLRDEALNSC